MLPYNGLGSQGQVKWTKVA